MGLIILAMLLGIIPAMIASKKGYSTFGWWVYGSLLFIIALPHALIIKPAPSISRICPFCAEAIKREAVVCRFCGKDLPAASLATDPAPIEWGQVQDFCERAGKAKVDPAGWDHLK